MTKGLNQLFINELKKQKKGTDIAVTITMITTITLVIFGAIGLAVISSLLATLLLLHKSEVVNQMFVLEREELDNAIEKTLKK